MKSTATGRFWKHYRELPAEVRSQAREAYERLLADPRYPSLHFKRVHPVRPVYSVRISRDCRALGILEGDEITWFWIGSHAEYDALLRQLRKS